MSHSFDKLSAFFQRLPAISSLLSTGVFNDGTWWIKFTINVEHPLAWRHVQELGYVLNYLSMNERLPTVFMPVSPPPGLNGGVEFLSWVIESKIPVFTPDMCVKWLEDRLPHPVEDPASWNVDEESET